MVVWSGKPSSTLQRSAWLREGRSFDYGSWKLLEEMALDRVERDTITDIAVFCSLREGQSLATDDGALGPRWLLVVLDGTPSHTVQHFAA